MMSSRVLLVTFQYGRQKIHKISLITNNLIDILRPRSVEVIYGLCKLGYVTEK